MCKFFKSRKEDSMNEGQVGWLKVYGVTIRIYEDDTAKEHFEEIYSHIEKKLGVPPSKTAVVKHCIAIAHQFYSQQIGIGSF